MFMRENRKKNGAPQPEQVASKDGAGQRRSRMLSPNDMPSEQGMDLRFSPDMSNCAAINSAHYGGGLDGDGPYRKSYEDNIHYLGTPDQLGRNKLKG